MIKKTYTYKTKSISIYKYPNGNIFVDAVAIGKANKSFPSYWLRKKKTINRIERCMNTQKVPYEDLIDRKKGKNGHTRMRYSIALAFSEELNPTFAIWLSDKLDSFKKLKYVKEYKGEGIAEKKKATEPLKVAKIETIESVEPNKLSIVHDSEHIDYSMIDYDIWHKDKRMSSLEIAEHFGKRHGNVIQDIEISMNKVAGLRIQSGSYNDINGQSRKMYALTQDETIHIVSKYDENLRWALIKRWKELETKYGDKLPSNQLDWLQISLDNMKKQQVQLDDNTNRIEKIETVTLERTGYYAIAPYVRQFNIDRGSKTWIAMGKEASKLSRERNVEIKKVLDVSDNKYPYVNAYHLDILHELYSPELLITN